MSSPVDRRHFLERSVAAGAAVGLTIAASASRAESPNETVVVGVMGLSRGRSLASSFSKVPNVVVKYACDADESRATSATASLAKQMKKAPEAITDFRRILDDAEVDALICAAPNHWHAPATILGCAAGKHVYVEKPCCHNPREGELMVQAARKHDRRVQMGSQRRSSPATNAAIEKLQSGVIGRVYLVRAWYNNLRPSLGRGTQTDPPAALNYELWQGPAPRVPFVNNRIHYNWHWFWHWGNGELGNNGVHTLDLCRWGMGVDFPTKATSAGGRYRYDDDQETPDTHTVCFEFSGDKKIVWEGLSCNKHKAGSFITFYGEKGALELESDGAHTVFDERDAKVSETPGTGTGEPEHVTNFVDAIRSGDSSSLNAEIEKGYRSTLLCHLGNISHRTGRSLHCDPASGRILDDEAAMKLWKRDYEPGWEPEL